MAGISKNVSRVLCTAACVELFSVNHHARTSARAAMHNQNFTSINNSKYQKASLCWPLKVIQGCLPPPQLSLPKVF